MKKAVLASSKPQKELYGFLFVLIGLYIGFYSLICFLKYSSFAYHDFDLAIHSQTLWNILHGSIETSILGVPFLGNHAHWILFFLAPLYALWSSPLLLLFLQTLALGLGAWPIYLIGSKWINPLGGLVFSALYLLYPALGYMNLFEFHPTTFSTLFLLWACWSFFEGKILTYTLFLILACLCQENLYLVAFMLGLYGLVERRGRSWVIPPLVIGLGGFVLTTQWLIPHFNQGRVGFENIYLHLGKNLKEVFLTIFFSPGYVLRFIFQGENMGFLLQLFVPLFLLSLLSPFILLIALPMFLQHLLSSRSTEHTLYYHYTAEIIPFIFLSAIDGMRNLLKLQKFKKKTSLLLGILALWGVGWAFLSGPMIPAAAGISNLKKDALDEIKEDFLEKVNRESVVATFEFLPRLANRKGLYSFHHLYSGTYTLSEKTYEVPKGVQVILVDFLDRLTFNVFDSPDADNRLRDFLQSGGWSAESAVENIVLFRQGVEEPFPIFQSGVQNESFNQPLVLFDGEMEYWGGRISQKEIQKGKTLTLSFFWQAKEKILKDYYLVIYLVNPTGDVVRQTFHPFCYRIYPASDWKENELIQENFNFLIPKAVPEGRYSVQFLVFDRASQRSAQGTSLSSESPIRQGRVHIGNVLVR